jgi:phosphopantetheinyl transferase
LKIIIEEIKQTDSLTIKFLTYQPHDLNCCKLSVLTKSEQIRFNSFKSNKRKLEYYYARILWQQFQIPYSIKYNEFGKPILEEGNLSISHSKNTIAIGFSKKDEIGLDIEHFNPKIFKIKSKFVSEIEKERFDLTDKIVLTTIWSIKEALFKMTPLNELSFKKHFEIISIGKKNEAKIKKGRYQQALIFEREIYKDFILTYCIHPKS